VCVCVAKSRRSIDPILPKSKLNKIQPDPSWCRIHFHSIRKLTFLFLYLAQGCASPFAILMNSLKTYFLCIDMISIYYTQCPGRMNNAASIVFDFSFLAHCYVLHEFLHLRSRLRMGKKKVKNCRQTHYTDHNRV
jgi:hypothetical protein